MPSQDPHNLNGSGLLLYTGLNPRPRDVREDKYRLALVPDLNWQGVDLSVPHTLLRDGWDPRPGVTWQGHKGACASVSTIEAAEEQCWQAGRGWPVALSGSAQYERVRRAENPSAWWQDTGSSLGGNLDIALGGCFTLADAPESDDLRRDYDQETSGKATVDYILGHLPAYPGEHSDPDYLLKIIAAAIDSGRSVILGSYWPDPDFYPDENGVLPVVSNYRSAGGHAYKAWAVLPILGGVVACRNHWNPPGGVPWNPQVVKAGWGCRPGDMLLPFALFRGPAPQVFEVRAVTQQPVIIPEPSWTPDPAVLAGFDWQRDDVGYARGRYTAGDIPAAGSAQEALGTYALDVAKYLAGLRGAPPLPAGFKGA